MAEIKELSSNLTDQIAAGEVIERPSSVVKELLENAIDAGADAIKIAVKNSGLSEIVIEDDGSGISENQIDLAFKRHATSKIMTTDDLFKVKTLGFRGEALASISAVSKVEIVTATKNGLGVLAEFSDGKRLKLEKHTAKKGTKIYVRDLFFNTPVRLKYLKSEKTELKNIIDIVNRIALSYPNLAIKLTNENKTLLQTSGNGNQQQDLAQVYGRKIAGEMVSFKGENDDFMISGYLSKPEVNRANRSYISILLNGRYIKNYQISNAIIQGYGSKLPQGKFPIAVINIKLDPILVDVNVHPTKQEVRLSKEQVLTQLISKTVFAALNEAEGGANAIENLQNPTNETEFDQLIFNLNKQLPEEIGTKSVDFKPQVTNFEVEETTAEFSITDPETSIVSKTWKQNVAIQKTLRPFDEVKSNELLTTEGSTTLANPLADLHYVASLKSGFIVADSNDGFYLINIKEGFYRIEYDRIIGELQKSQQSQQILLTPLVIEFSNLEYQNAQERLEKLAEYGIVLEDFGKNTMILKAVPNFVEAGKEEEFVSEVLDPKINRENLREAMAKKALRYLKVDNKFDEKTGTRFLTELISSSDPYQSPTGKLIMAQFKLRDLDKMFKRI